MYIKFESCPNPKCSKSQGKHKCWYIKKGYYKTKFNHQKVPRYKCKSCGRFFSTHTFKKTVHQKKPQLNDPVFKFYVSGITQRRLAIVLGCDRKTVVRKFLFMARLAREEHEKHLKGNRLKTSYVQMDEMETFEHTRLKPLSIAIAVRAKTGEILEAQAAQLNYKGKLANVALKKYGKRKNLSSVAVEDCLLSVKKCSRESITIETDKKKSYASKIKKILPHATHYALRSRRPFYEKNNDPNKPLFTLNYTCAKVRNDLSRMARKTWVTTKAMWALQAHLDLYIAWNNGYKLKT